MYYIDKQSNLTAEVIHWLSKEKGAFTEVTYGVNDILLTTEQPTDWYVKNIEPILVEEFIALE